MIEMSSYVKLNIGIHKNNLEMEEGLGCGWQLAASTSVGVNGSPGGFANLIPLSWLISCILLGSSS